ncbi:MAG: glycosyltransferase family 2 protein, partial [Acidobacteria bacterium]|nr:glycosyltransferase family 2 protein [Acidobacteriota bacterium]
MAGKQTFHVLEARPHPKLLSIVVTVYNEEDALPFLRRRLDAFLETLPCMAELILVNDGSNDESLRELILWANQDPRVRVLNLARNFGHQAAATAGLDQATGGAIVLMDADLQDPPEVIAQMLDEYCKGYDVVYGQRTSRAGETAFKRFTAWGFYRIMRALVHPDLPADVGDFRLVSRNCLNALLSMRETHRFLRGMVAWVGFPQAFVPYARDSRVAGTTK